MKAARNISSEATHKISPQLISLIEGRLRERAESLRAMKNQANRDAAAQIEVAHPDEVDLATAQESAEASRMMAEALRMELLQVNDALERIRSGSFGVCEDCDAVIPPKRLEIRPEARLCIDCQSEEERHFGRSRLSASGRGEIAYAG